MADTNTIELRINRAYEEIKETEAKIEEKLKAVDYEKSQLSGGIKGHVTKWENKVEELKEQIKEDKETVKSLRRKSEAAPSSGGGVSTSTTSSGLSKELKNLKHDFSGQPMFVPGRDVSLFVRSMQMVWNSHVKHNSNLEADFCAEVEYKIDPSYRLDLQEYVAVKGRFTTWATMKAYLVKTHRSCTTIYQELKRFTALPINRGETVKEYSLRIKQAADEAKTIISSKFKEQTTKDLTVDSLWELVSCDAIVRMMQGHSQYRHHYNDIVNNIDECVTVDLLSQKASKIADRKLTLDDMAPETYMATKTQPSTNDVLMEKLSTLEKKMTLMASYEHKPNDVKGHKSKDVKEGKPKSKKPNPKYLDPEWRKRQETKPCFTFAHSGKCERKMCAFQPCNGLSTGKSLFTKADF